MIVVSDTSPINYLILTDYVHVLQQLYGHIVLPERVLEELTSAGAPAIVNTWCSAPPAWVEIRMLSKTDSQLKLTGGERDTILLSEELGADLMLMDERSGR